MLQSCILMIFKKINGQLVYNIQVYSYTVKINIVFSVWFGGAYRFQYLKFEICQNIPWKNKNRKNFGKQINN